MYVQIIVQIIENTNSIGKNVCIGGLQVKMHENMRATEKLKFCSSIKKLIFQRETRC